MESKRRTQAERTASTRAALIAAARPRFGAHGYAGVSTPDVVEAAGVSRGALYHHFVDKAALFAAVLEAVEAEVTERIAEAALLAPSGDALESLRVGAAAWLDATADPEVRQILLLDGPVVLGWPGWRDLTARYGLGLTEAALAAGVADGSVRPGPVSTMAHLLLGALNEAAQLVAGAEDPAAARAEVDAVVDLMLDSLRPPR
jgi:AcrR family transcriptional regulator